MQTPSSNPKKNSARRRSADPHARLSARLRHISFGAAVLLVVVAALTVIYSLYKIQIRDGATYRQYAAEQQLLDSTIQATRGEIYDTSGITLASTSVVWTIWADPSYSTALYTTTTDQDTKAEIRTIDEAAMKEVCTQITLRLLSGDGESGQRGHHFGRVPDPVSGGLRCPLPKRKLLSGAGHQGQQRHQALH